MKTFFLLVGFATALHGTDASLHGVQDATRDEVSQDTDDTRNLQLEVRRRTPNTLTVSGSDYGGYEKGYWNNDSFLRTPALSKFMYDFRSGDREFHRLRVNLNGSQY